MPAATCATDFISANRSNRAINECGIRVEQPGDLAPALSQAIDAGETVVVDVITSIDARAPEAWLPGQT